MSPDSRSIFDVMVMTAKHTLLKKRHVESKSYQEKIAELAQELETEVKSKKDNTWPSPREIQIWKKQNQLTEAWIEHERLSMETLHGMVEKQKEWIIIAKIRELFE